MHPIYGIDPQWGPTPGVWWAGSFLWSKWHDSGDGVVVRPTKGGWTYTIVVRDIGPVDPPTDFGPWPTQTEAAEAADHDYLDPWFVATAGIRAVATELLRESQ